MDGAGKTSLQNYDSPVRIWVSPPKKKSCHASGRIFALYYLFLSVDCYYTVFLLSAIVPRKNRQNFSLKKI